VGQQTLEPRVTTEYQVRTIYRDVEKIVYEPEEKIITQIIYEPVEKVVIRRIEKPVPLRSFEDLDELKEWLGNTGVIDIHFNITGGATGATNKLDCDDYAIELQEKALTAGYIVSFEVIGSAEYNTHFEQKKIPGGVIHAINSVVIGNEIYYIEPQNHEVVFAAYLD